MLRAAARRARARSDHPSLTRCCAISSKRQARSPLSGFPPRYPPGGAPPRRGHSSGRGSARRRGRALVGRVRRGARRLRARDGLLGALGAARSVDLLGDARGIAAGGHRRRRAAAAASGIDLAPRAFRRLAGGFWLPECAYAPWLDAAARGGRRARDLRRAHRRLRPGARGTCGRCAGDRACARAARSRDDRARVERRRLPGRAAATATTTTAPTTTTACGPTTATPTTRGRARAGRAARPRLRRAACRGARRRRRRSSVCALDTELLGHWWYEGVAVAGGGGRGVRAPGTRARAPRRRARRDAAGAGSRRRRLGVSSWGEAERPATWAARRSPKSPAQLRAAELRAVAARRAAPATARVRELLALQSSDWAFLATTGTAGEYPRERSAGHAEALARPRWRATRRSNRRLRNLAPDARPAGCALGDPPQPGRTSRPSGTSAAPRASGSAAPGSRRRRRWRARRR